MTKSRADLNIAMKEFARDSAESQMEGGLQDGAGLLEVVNLPSYFLFSTSGCQGAPSYMFKDAIFEMGLVGQDKRNIGLDMSLTLGIVNFKVDPSFFG